MKSVLGWMNKCYHEKKVPKRLVSFSGCKKKQDLYGLEFFEMIDLCVTMLEDYFESTYTKNILVLVYFT